MDCSWGLPIFAIPSPSQQTTEHATPGPVGSSAGCAIGARPVRIDRAPDSVRLQLTPHGRLALQPVPAANANGDSERRVAPGPIDQSPVSLPTAVTALAVLAPALPLTLSATSAFLLFPFLRSGHIHLHCAVFLSLLLAPSLGFALTGKNKQPLWLCPQPGHPGEVAGMGTCPGSVWRT